jgi:hypothetical protein
VHTLGLIALVLAATQYPSGMTVSQSGRHAIENKDFGEKSVSGNDHALYVVNLSSKKKTLLIEYPHEVALEWAPNREVIAVTNYWTANESTVLLYEIASGKVIDHADVRKVLETAFPKLRRELSKYTHVYLEVIRWHQDGRVECRLSAQAGKGKSIHGRRYLVGLNGKARAL